MPHKTRNIIAFLGLLIVSTTLFSQQVKDTAKGTSVKHKILLVPFKTTMLMCQIGKAVNTKTHLSYKKIAESFRSQMDLALYNICKQNYPTISLIQGADKTDTTLAYIYNAIGYKYDLLPGRDTTGESHAEFDPKQQKAHFIKNGQLQVPQDYSKRFMNVAIANPDLLPYLNKKYDADIFVFVNEVDIKNIPNNTTDDLTQSNFRREVTVQYSVLTTQKQSLGKGILITYFPYTENDPKIIGEQYFTIIARSIMKEILKKFPKNEGIKSYHKKINSVSKTK